MRDTGNFSPAVAHESAAVPAHNSTKTSTTGSSQPRNKGAKGKRAG